MSRTLAEIADTLQEQGRFDDAEEVRHAAKFKAAYQAQRAEEKPTEVELPITAVIVVQNGVAGVICPEIRLLPDGEYPLKVFTAPGKPSPFGPSQP